MSKNAIYNYGEMKEGNFPIVLKKPRCKNRGFEFICF